MKPCVFISYSQKDLEFVKKLKASLEAAQIGVTIDLEAAKIGDHLQQFIETAVRENLATVMVISRNSLQSVWVMAEALENWMYEKTEGRKRFLPIFIDRSLFDDDFFLEVAASLVNKITDLAVNADKAVKMGVGTAHFDLDRKRLETLRNNLDTLFKTLRERLSADLTTKVKIRENLPKLIAEIQPTIDQKSQKPEPINENDAEEELRGKKIGPKLWLPEPKAIRMDIPSLRNAYLKWLMYKTGYVALADIDPRVNLSEAEARLNLDAIYTALLTVSAERQEGEQFLRQEEKRNAGFLRLSLS